MKLTSLLGRTQIFVPMRAKSKRHCLSELARRAAPVAGLDERELLSALLEREKLGSTGAGHGVAIPHARIPDLTDSFVFFARLELPVDFDSVDGEPVDLVFLILAPDAAGSQHLKILSRIAKSLRNETVRKRLRLATNPKDVLQALDEDHISADEATPLARAVQ